MAEIQEGSRQAFKGILQNVFGVDDASLREDFASIGIFMSDKNKVKAALLDVSEKIRAKYNEIAASDTDSNVLTRAIHSIANDAGFNVQSNVVFAGFIRDQDITPYIRGKVLWKDGVSSNHGEHTHSLQWLCIENEMSGKAAALYAASAKYQANKNFNRPGGTMKPRVWDMLVDSFGYGPAADFKTNVCTRTPRSPAIFNRNLQTETTWKQTWISAIIMDRVRRKKIPAPTNEGTRSAAQNLKDMTKAAHADGKGYVGKSSGPGMIYERGADARTERTRPARGLARLEGKVDRQERSGSDRLPLFIKMDDGKTYKVVESEKKKSSRTEDVNGSRVEFEVWGDQAAGIVYL